MKLVFVITGIVLCTLMLIVSIMVEKVRQHKKDMRYFTADSVPPKFYITGDKHRKFDTVELFCKCMKTRPKDVLIILGDSGFNYFEDYRDEKLKEKAARMNITLFCLHGNKECRPQNIGTYGIRSFCGGKVYYEPKYPSIFFAIDGQVYTFEGRKYMVVGGAHSVDKIKCLNEGLPFWEDEMPDDATKATVETTLADENNKVYGMLTHTCPLKYLPTERFLSTRREAEAKRKSWKIKRKKRFQPDIDRSTEQWFDYLEEKVDYKVWFCGHYHVDKQIENVYMLHREIRPLHLSEWDCK